MEGVESVYMSVSAGRVSENPLMDVSYYTELQHCVIFSRLG